MTALCPELLVAQPVDDGVGGVAEEGGPDEDADEDHPCVTQACQEGPALRCASDHHTEEGQEADHEDDGDSEQHARGLGRPVSHLFVQPLHDQTTGQQRGLRLPTLGATRLRGGESGGGRVTARVTTRGQQEGPPGRGVVVSLSVGYHQVRVRAGLVNAAARVVRCTWPEGRHDEGVRFGLVNPQPGPAVA